MRKRAPVIAGLAIAVTLSAGQPLAEARTERLSDEKTFSRWAHPNDRAPVRRAPNGSSRTITRLRFLTEDRRPEIYLALRRTWDRSGQEWVKIRLPRRPNGTTGWVRRESFGPWHHVRTRLVINRRTLRAKLYRNGRQIWSSRVGVGAPGTPTPAGRFYIREKLRSLQGGTIYGPLAFGTSAYSSLSDWPRGGVVGIHGTNQPWLIPGRPSHGCVRVPNRKIRQLGRRMPLGTPVRIY
jgi:L,D-transpeptidase catalytic domain